MKDFTVVGRRLRRWRILAFPVAAIGLLVCISGVAAYWNHGPPSRWSMRNDGLRIDGAYGVSRYVPIPTDDPDYLAIMRGRESELMYFLLWGSGIIAVGALAYAASRKAPAKETLHLAQARQGVLTLPEVSTALDIDPQLAAKALGQLQKLKIAVPRWQDIRRNIWEFPDYMELPPEPDIAYDAMPPRERPLAPSPSLEAVPGLASEAGPAQKGAAPGVMVAE